MALTISTSVRSVRGSWTSWAASTLADWWPVISPVEEYADEAAELRQRIAAHHPTARTVLEFGSGGGHVAFYLCPYYTCCLTDLSAEMLAVSRRLNPTCEHLQGDMRTIALGRAFDVVLVHDAIDYMTTEAVWSSCSPTRSPNATSPAPTSPAAAARTAVRRGCLNGAKPLRLTPPRL
jgi:SAM-dependent methyltransferase